MSTIWSIPCPPHQDDICYCWVGWATIISKGIKEEQMVHGCILFYWVGQNVHLGFLQDRMEKAKQIFGQPYTLSVSQEIWGECLVPPRSGQQSMYMTLGTWLLVQLPPPVSGRQSGTRGSAQQVEPGSCQLIIPLKLIRGLHRVNMSQSRKHAN